VLGEVNRDPRVIEQLGERVALSLIAPEAAHVHDLVLAFDTSRDDL
jgi:hypothetical protein